MKRFLWLILAVVLMTAAGCRANAKKPEATSSVQPSATEAKTAEASHGEEENATQSALPDSSEDAQTRMTAAPELVPSEYAEK